MKPARYIFLNQGLEMSVGKASAQAAHAEMLAMDDFHTRVFDNYRDAEGGIDIWVEGQMTLYGKWIGEGHYAKYVMRAEDATQMYTIERYLRERDFETYMVIDEGHTEGTYFVPTAMAIELVNKDDERTASIFDEFRRYKDAPRKPSQSERPESWFTRLTRR